MTDPEVPSSPAWGSTTKLVVALTVVAIAAGLFIQFHVIIGPLLMAIVLAYLFHPIAAFLQRITHLAWPIAVTLIYLVLFIFLLGLVTVGGLGLIQQVQSLISFIQNNLASLPDLIQKLSGQVYHFGPFQFDFRTLDLSKLSSQLLGLVQPLLGQTGDLLSNLAGGAAQIVGWALFLVLISYFILTESGGLRGQLVGLDIPGYAADIQRLRYELGLIWNAFLRGQIIVFLLTMLTYIIVFGALGVVYAIGIAILAGFSKFVPYVGSFITWTSLALVAYFQPFTPFGLKPLTYMIIVVGLAIMIDQTYDNFVTPRIIAKALRVHPAAVLVAAIIAANYLGILGVVVAAPMLATAALLWRYTLSKLLDLDPWPEPESEPPSPLIARLLGQIRHVWDRLRKRNVKAQ